MASQRDEAAGFAGFRNPPGIPTLYPSSPQHVVALQAHTPTCRTLAPCGRAVLASSDFSRHGLISYGIIDPMTASKLSKLPGLLTPSFGYKPFRYPWAYDFWKRQQQVHWMPEEVPLGEDCKDWAAKLNDSERNLLTQIFRFFTQSRRRGERQLHGALRPGVQTDRGEDDAGGVLQHGDHPHRRLRAAARDHRHARERVRRLPRVSRR